MIDRRHFLRGAASAGLLVRPGLALAAADTDKRFVVIILRGAMDGLSAVVPYGDPAYAPARAALAIGDGVKLDGTFALHPAMKRTAGFWAAKQALPVHAVASPYRDRSHFDGQNVLECGGVTAYSLKDGWLNRALPLIPGRRAVAIAPTVPPMLQGRVGVESYAPSRADGATPDLFARVGGMYQNDPLLHPLWEQALAARKVAGGSVDDGRNLPGLAQLAAKFLIAPGGARIAVLESLGWDTHAGQNGRLASQLTQLDAAFGALADGLGPAWADTVVVAVTEFGRTVAANGTGGTDHGTGSAAFVVGGAVKGGRVIADWPGLQSAALYENRDLKPTTNLHAVLTGLIAEHYGIEPGKVQRAAFPVTPDGKPLEGLVRA